MKKRVLIFEDDQAISEVSKRILEIKGYKVDTLENCDNILQFVDDRKPDLIIMDYMIPGNNGGVDSTKILKANIAFKNIPVILFSAHPEIEKLALSAGADGYLPKPFDINALEEMVAKHIEEATVTA